MREKRLGGQKMFVPLAHPPGAAQADFGEALVVVDCVERKAHYLVVDLPHSDDAFVQAFPAETTEAFCAGHTAAFAYFGGRAASHRLRQQQAGRLRRLLEARLGKAGTREYVQVLRLLEDFRLAHVGGAVRDALALGVISFDAVKHLVLCRIEHRPPAPPRPGAVSASAGRARGDDRGRGLPGAAGGRRRVMAKPTRLLDAQLKALRLPTFLREYDKAVSSHWRFQAVPHSHGRPPVGAFRDAIHEVVGPGSGILGMYACEARALRVYSIEEGPMIAVARAVSRANGFEGRQIFVYGSSTAIGLPENVDVNMADQIGHFGCEAGMFEFFADARARFMKPDGVAMPSHLGLYLAAIEDAEVFGWVQFWRQHPGGFDFEPARAWSAHTGYPKKLNADQLLGDPVRASRFRWLTCRPGCMRAT